MKLKMNSLKLTLIASFILSFPFSLVFSAFREIGTGVRPEGMGGAFVSVANDANAIVYNPAGTVLIKGSEVSFGYSKSYAGLGNEININQSYTAFARSINRNLGYGVAWSHFSSSNLKENSLFLNFAMNFGAIFKSNRDIIVATNIKRMNETFVLDERAALDPVFAGGNEKTVYGYDLGTYLKPMPESMPEVSFGLLLKNINRPDVGLRAAQPLPIEKIAGLSYQKESYLFTLDVSERNGISSYRGGAEAWFLDKKIGFRGGANSLNGSLGFSYRVSAKRNSIGLDYAFIVPFFIQDSAGSHRFALALHR